ncbi:UbiA-like protein EboC [Leptospira sp. WS39.C2]
MNIKSFIVLLRPANLVTAIADSLAGMAIVSFVWDKEAVFLVFASVCLYGGGVVLNDFFDRVLDAKERPERPIPSGKVTPNQALILGVTLLAIGVIFSYFYSEVSLVISLIIVFFILFYDIIAKHHFVLGPLVMGFCRGMNLVLGMSVLKQIPLLQLPISILPIIYIAAITIISQNEVFGGGKWKFVFSGFLYFFVLLTQAIYSIHNQFFIFTLPFLCLHSFLLFPPLWKAIQNPIPPLVGNAVKIGVITLILLNASFAASFGMIPVALVILILLPISLIIAKYFAVT